MNLGSDKINSCITSTKTIHYLCLKKYCENFGRHFIDTYFSNIYYNIFRLNTVYLYPANNTAKSVNFRNVF